MGDHGRKTLCYTGCVVVCPTCKAPLEPNARFCPKDGTTIRPDSVLVPVASMGHAATVAVRTRKKPPTATTDPAVDPLIGKLLDGRYRIRARLGEGGVGAVYEAEHVQIKKTVALKVLHAIYSTTEEFQKRFEREARAASRLSHPGCVQVLDFGRVEKVEPADDTGRTNGMPYLVMEFVRGQPLLDRLIDGPPIEPHEAVGIARDVLAALEHAHGLGIVHRDLKPANIMLTGDHTRTKLLDFGLAKDLDGDSKEALTQAGMVFGTPGYLSPEQAAGRKVDARSDLYSMGVVLFEMVCNRRLFERDDPLDAVRDHLNTPPPDPRSINPSVSHDLAAAISKALEKDREKRFASAEAFAGRLAGTPEASGRSNKTAGPVALRTLLLRSAGGRPIWQWGVAGLTAIAVIVGILAAASRTRAPIAAPPMTLAPALAFSPSPPAVSDGARFAFDLLREDKVDEAMAAARAALRDRPHDGSAHDALATAYARKLWCSDALEELERAVRDDLRLRDDPNVARRAIACLGPKTNARAARFLGEKLGAVARPVLQAAATGEPNLELRRAAQKVLDRMP